METAVKKVTMATIKSFVRKNRAALQIDCESRFDGMEDGVRRCGDRGFSPALECRHSGNTLGIQGAWFVGSSRDYFKPYNDNGMIGYYVYNCCGSFTIAVPARELVK